MLLTVKQQQSMDQNLPPATRLSLQQLPRHAVKDYDQDQRTLPSIVLQVYDTRQALATTVPTCRPCP
jgi:hypothetical protein